MTAGATLFFILSKVAGFFTEPSNLLGVVGLAGVALLGTRFARAGRRMMAAALVLLAALGWSPAGRALLLPLEQRFPPWDAAGGSPAGIVILGGSIDGRLSTARGTPALNESAERLTAAVSLALKYPRARVLFSGGSGELLFQDDKEAPAARRLLVDLGLPESRVEIEDRSRNTVENAVFSKEIARPQPGERWLLVTSAHHMPRSVGVFRRAGFPVEAYPVDWRTRGSGDLVEPFSALSAGLRRVDVAAHEWVGLVAYWLAGRTSELFPGPGVSGCDRTGKDGCRP